MTQVQEAFLSELKSKTKMTAAEYKVLFEKYTELAFEEELKNGANERRARTMADYYAVTVLSDFLNNDNTLSRITGKA